MEYDGKFSGAVRALTGYSGARRFLPWKTFSPTQSLTRLNSRSFGASAVPPSQPHAANAPTGPATIPSLKRSRRLKPWVGSVMAGEPSPVPPGDHRAKRCRVHQQHQNDVHQSEGDEDPDEEEVPVPGQLVAAEERGEPGKLHRLVDGEAAGGGQPPRHHDERIGQFLQRVVLSLRRMFRAKTEIVALHLPGGTDVAEAEDQRTPFPGERQEAEIDQAGYDKGPGEGEVPVEAGGQPSTQPGPLGEALPIPRIGQRVDVAPRTEVPVGAVDLEPAPDHAEQQHRSEPMGDPYDPVMAFDHNSKDYTEQLSWRVMDQII